MPKDKESPHLEQKLAEAIKRKGVTQAAVAKHFNVKPPTVSGDWIKRGTIDKKHYPGLVEYFGLPYEWWFGEESKDRKKTAPTEITEDQEKMLLVMSRLDQKTQTAFANLFDRIIPERRIQDVGHSPDRRRPHSDILYATRLRPAPQARSTEKEESDEDGR